MARAETPEPPGLPRLNLKPPAPLQRQPNGNLKTKIFHQSVPQRHHWCIRKTMRKHMHRKSTNPINCTKPATTNAPEDHEPCMHYWRPESNFFAIGLPIPLKISWRACVRCIRFPSVFCMHQSGGRFQDVCFSWFSLCFEYAPVVCARFRTHWCICFLVVLCN